MTRARERTPRPEARPSRALAVLADLTTAYPLLLFGCLYGQWLLSWWMLGHQPRPSLDDPKDIAGASWMGWMTGCAILGWMPAFFAAAVLQTVRGLRERRPGPNAALRLGLVFALGLGTLALLRADPGRVVSWWLD